METLLLAVLTLGQVVAMGILGVIALIYALIVLYDICFTPKGQPWISTSLVWSNDKPWLRN